MFRLQDEGPGLQPETALGRRFWSPRDPEHGLEKGRLAQWIPQPHGVGHGRRKVKAGALPSSKSRNASKRQFSQMATLYV